MTQTAAKPRQGDPLQHLRVWSIGIYAGKDPLTLKPAARNPVLTARDIFDVNAHFVADPFWLHSDDVWHMYFEVMPRESKPGVIGLATSPDALQWTYRGIVLQEPFHLSYPQIFAWQGDVFLLPETLGAGCVRLYRAADFPVRFVPAADLLPGRWADPTIFRHDGRWWLYACSTPYENRTLYLFFADDLFGPWHSHPRNPIVADDRQRARPGGRVLTAGSRLIRFAQDCVPRYGSQLRALEIMELTPVDYREIECLESPVLTPSNPGWNSNGMHHMDLHQVGNGAWLACVDGDTIVQAA